MARLHERTRPPGDLRFLASRRYSGEEAREWSVGWHAPRLNRWERLRVAGGTASVERLTPTGIMRVCVSDREECWFGPGERWRLGSLDRAATLEIAPHAQDAVSSARPDSVRERWLCNVPGVRLDDARALRDLLDALLPGERRLCTGRFDWSEAIADADLTRGSRLAWHPLAAHADGRFAALALHSECDVDLVDYLARDHAIIEAALSLAVHGGTRDRERFQGVLLRHVAIEEQMLFPDYTNTAARRHTVDGLLLEHNLIKNCLAEGNDPAALRRLWRLLEAHDEKEEQIVYPALASASSHGSKFLRIVLRFPPPSVSLD